MLKHKLLLAMLILIGLAVCLPQAGHSRPAKKGKLLYMTLTKGFHHESVELSKQIVKEMGEKSGAYDDCDGRRGRLYQRESEEL